MPTRRQNQPMDLPDDELAVRRRRRKRSFWTSPGGIIFLGTICCVAVVAAVAIGFKRSGKEKGVEGSAVQSGTDQVTHNAKEQEITAIRGEEITDLYKSNELAADVRFKGKRFRLLAYVQDVGRDESGQAWIGQTVGVNPPKSSKPPRSRISSIEDFQRRQIESSLNVKPPALDFFCFFTKDREQEAGKCSKSCVYIVEGTCSGLSTMSDGDKQLRFTDTHIVEQVMNPPNFVWPPKS